MNSADPPLVAHLIYRLSIGGLENGLVNLINWMPAERYRHVIICLTDHSDFRDRIRREGVEIYSLNKKPGQDFLVHVRLWKLLRRLRPQILHTRNIGTMEYVLTAFLAGVPVRVHGEHGWQTNDISGQRLHYRVLRRVLQPLITRVVCVSKDIQSWMIEKLSYPARKVRQVYSGVDTSRFRPISTTRPAPVPENAFVIGLVARLDPIKDPLTLVAAFSRLEAAGPREPYLVVIGDGPLYEELSQNVESAELSDRVYMPGARDDVPRLMQAMDLFVLPSLNEGISNTILEAMASGLPVLATRVGGNSELVEEGKTGTLFSPGNVVELTSLMARYLQDPEMCRRQGRAARQRAESCFSPRSMVQGYLDVYDELTTVGA